MIRNVDNILILIVDNFKSSICSLDCEFCNFAIVLNRKIKRKKDPQTVY